MFNINFAGDWIQTTDLWYRKRPLYQQSHNHCLDLDFLLSVVVVVVGSFLKDTSLHKSKSEQINQWLPSSGLTALKISEVI